ncbi:MAG TPA: D-2-hydroxyacid dehydrogenase family protein [Bryobacteraceae bacterium]|nr:D-2-hydroxyacid dehydrogenase family protein [Bryobacteraceae bacterium]
MKIVAVPDDAPAVLALSPSFDRLKAAAEVRYFDTLPGVEDVLVDRMRDAESVVNVRSSSKITRAVMERCPVLRHISIWGTGTDNVDLDAARALGIRVTNTPAVSATSIAEHTLALMLAVARRVPQIDARVRAGEWPRGGTVQLHGKTLGVIGLGEIGRRFARLGQGIGMRVVTWTMNPKPELGFPHVSIEELLTSSDVVSLHLRLSEQTRGFLDASRIALMKPRAILLNTARGPIVDERAMMASLRSGQLGGAGLDVFDVEPLPEDHPLKGMENVVLSPHAAGITPEALEAGLSLAVDNVLAYFSGNVRNAVV